MAKKSAVIVGSLVGVFVLGTIAFAIARAGKSEGSSEGSNELMTPESALQFIKAALGIPTSVAMTTGASGRSYQVAVWALANKEAVLVTSLSPRTVYALARDSSTHETSELVDVFPDNTARTDIAALVKSF